MRLEAATNARAPPISTLKRPHRSRSRWRRPISNPRSSCTTPLILGGPATPPNKAPRRRPAGPMNAEPRQKGHTVFHPKNFKNRPTVPKIGFIAAVPGADPTVCCRVLHRIFLTPRLSCGARAPQPLCPRPPARRLLQPVVSQHVSFGRSTPGKQQSSPRPRRLEHRLNLQAPIAPHIQRESSSVHQ